MPFLHPTHHRAYLCLVGVVLISILHTLLLSMHALRYTIPEGCAGSCCASCLSRSASLKCCSRCRRAWYCSTECQKAHWQAVHKQACKAAQPFITALEELKIAAPISYENAQQPLTLVGTQVLQSSSLKPLNKEVFTMVTAGNPFCRVCWKTRSDVPTADRNNFRCCPKCMWAWCCSEQHWKQHAKHHAKFCPTYAAMSGCSLLQRQHYKRFGDEQGPLHYVPQGKMLRQTQRAVSVGAVRGSGVPRRQQLRLPESWAEYQQMRKLPCFQENAWLLMTEGLSIPLTAAYACTQLYSDSQLASMDDFVLHLAGSSDYELDQVTRTAVIEELMHLLPAVKKLHVVMAGPDLVRILNSNVRSEPFDKGTCPTCEEAGCSRFSSFFRGAYEAYAASKFWLNPHLVLAMNSGVGQTEADGWSPAVTLMLDQQLPCCFTSMQQDEAAQDFATLIAAGAHVVAGPEANPLKSLVPFADSSVGPDRFYYRNAYLSCFRGRQTPAGDAK